MSLPYRQQWQLRHIDNALGRSDPHLAAMLAIFTRLTAGEKICDAERVRGRAWRLLAGLISSIAICGAWVVRGAARAGHTMAAAGRRLPGGPLLRRARPAGGTQPGLRRSR